MNTTLESKMKDDIAGQINKWRTLHEESLLQRALRLLKSKVGLAPRGTIIDPAVDETVKEILTNKVLVYVVTYKESVGGGIASYPYKDVIISGTFSSFQRFSDRADYIRTDNVLFYSAEEWDLGNRINYDENPYPDFREKLINLLLEDAKRR